MRGPRFPMGAVFGGALFAAAVVGWCWIGTLAGVGAGLYPTVERAGAAIAQVVRP